MPGSRFILRSVAVSFLAFTAAGPSHAGTGQTVACEIMAWSTDEDPNGLNVRAAPGDNAPIIATLPPPVETEGYLFATEMHVTGSDGGWFRIDEAMVIDYIGDNPTKVVFHGEGWVSGGLIGLGLNHRNLHNGPSVDAPIVATLFNGQEGTGADSFVVDRMHSCRGRWVEVEGDFLGTRHRGWTTGTCTNQVTTCP